jgi:hypothetical protein
MGAAPKFHFSQDSQDKSPEIGIPTILEAHNFLCKPLIEARSKENL